VALDAPALTSIEFFDINPRDGGIRLATTTADKTKSGIRVDGFRYTARQSDADTVISLQGLSTKMAGVFPYLKYLYVDVSPANCIDLDFVPPSSGWFEHLGSITFRLRRMRDLASAVRIFGHQSKFLQAVHLVHQEGWSLDDTKIAAIFKVGFFPNEPAIR
jgi:hypothetical protein